MVQKDMSEQKKFTLHEDWTVVILGGLIILLSISGLIVPVADFNWANTEELFRNVFSAGNSGVILIQFLFVLTIAVLAAVLMRKGIKDYLLGLPVIYLITMIALILAGNNSIKSLNLEAVIFSLLLGLIIGNFFHLPEWLRKSLSTELFVKIGLILLGTNIIFSDILKAGSLGLIQALAVVLSVWYFAFWLCKKLKIDDELTMMISSAVSICGVSAASPHFGHRARGLARFGHVPQQAQSGRIRRLT